MRRKPVFPELVPDRFLQAGFTTRADSYRGIKTWNLRDTENNLNFKVGFVGFVLHVDSASLRNFPRVNLAGVVLSGRSISTQAARGSWTHPELRSMV